jgi:hypothetical protein
MNGRDEAASLFIAFALHVGIVLMGIVLVGMVFMEMVFNRSAHFRPGGARRE